MIWDKYLDLFKFLVPNRKKKKKKEKKEAKLLLNSQDVVKDQMRYSM